MKDSGRSGWLAACALVTLVGALLRVPGLFSDLWFDEVWSLEYALTLESPLDVFTKVHHDSNHYLNTLFMYLLGAQEHWAVYRIPAFLAGVASIPVAGLLSRELTPDRRGRLEPLVAMALVALCSPLVFYASEARGYGLLILFTLLAPWCVLRYARTGRRAFAAATCACAILGFLSHLTFLHVFVATIAHDLRTLPAPKMAQDPSGNHYALEATYPAGSLSGFTWAVYRRIP